MIKKHKARHHSNSLNYHIIPAEIEGADDIISFRNQENITVNETKNAFK